jgi:hypothetical protein
LLAAPQQAFACAQHAEPFAQQFCGAAQQPLFSAQHFMPFSQQPSLASASQQALLGLQQASLAAQQSFDFSPAAPVPANSPSMRIEPAKSFVNMRLFSSLVFQFDASENSCAHQARAK